MSGIGGNYQLHGLRTGFDPDVAPHHAPDLQAPAEAAPARAPAANAPTSSAWAVRVAATSARPAAQAGRAEAMPDIRQGSKGEAVKELQTKLNEFRASLGLKQLPVTGTFGPQTQDAVLQYQKMWGIDAKGNVGTLTWRRLLGEPNPKPSTPVPGTIASKVMAHRDAIVAASQKYGIPPAIIAGMIEKESGGRADVVGITHDKGLMQINQDAHPKFFAHHDWKDAKQNAEYGVGLLATNLKVFNGDISKALAAYNAGQGGVRSGLRNGKTLDEITYKPKYVSGIESYARKYQDFF